MKLRAVFALLMVLALLPSCGNKKESATRPIEYKAPSRDSVSHEGEFVADEGEPTATVKRTLQNKDFKLLTTPFHTDAHQKYLDDPMQFSAFPDQSVIKGDSAVVGSDVCVFYPGAKLDATHTLEQLPKGTPIPFGTIVQITGERIEDTVNSERIGMFSFQDNWNWFYPVKWQGKDGLVFGADLYGLGETLENNRVSARLYQTGGIYDAFYPVTGYRPLSAAITGRMASDRVAFQQVSKEEYNLYSSIPDDFIALYSKLRPSDYSNSWNRKTPMFVTTDIAAHAQHLIFDRTLQYLEETFFAPRLKALCADFIVSLQKLGPKSDAYAETRDKAILYFQVAQALLDLAPEKGVVYGEYDRTEVAYKDRDRETVLAAYPEAVRLEIAKMDRAEGFEESAIFTFSNGSKVKEDYSQYKPRGHYTKNGVLSAYFRAMMWFGRMHFLIADAGPGAMSPEDIDTSDSIRLTLAMEPIALLFTDMVREDAKLYREWKALFEPITALIGFSDDLGFDEVMPLWKEQKVSDFGSWTSSRDNLLAFMKLAHQRLRPPAISGSSVFSGPSEGPDRKPPMGWRLFGQRFTYDSFVHHRVSPPRLMSRDMVRGLDIMKAFGSRTADRLLAESDYPKMEGLEDRLDSIESEYGAFDEAFWKYPYYNQVLYQVKSLAQFENGAGFFFTESPAWGIKAMLSSHGTWAELRHDTLLYVKQSYAERAGDGDFEPTFRTKPIPDPVHYIEPNVPFWQGSVLAVQTLMRTLNDFDLLDEESATALGRLHEIYVRAERIAGTESRDAPVSKDDLAWIPTIPAELARLVLVHTGGGDVMDEEQLKMAIIADVFTNAELGLVLETGVGIPYRIYVPLNDGQGGKRIALGYCFSYYEFHQPIGNRLTDEDWKATVYKPGVNLGQYQPFWAKDLTLPPEKKQ